MGAVSLPGHPQHLIDGQIVRDEHNHAVVKHHGRDGDELELVGGEGDFSAFALVYSICMGFATAFAIWYPPFKYVYSALAPSMVTGSVGVANQLPGILIRRKEDDSGGVPRHQFRGGQDDALFVKTRVAPSRRCPTRHSGGTGRGRTPDNSRCRSARHSR